MARQWFNVISLKTGNTFHKCVVGTVGELKAELANQPDNAELQLTFDPSNAKDKLWPGGCYYR